MECDFGVDWILRHDQWSPLRRFSCKFDRQKERKLNKFLKIIQSQDKGQVRSPLAEGLSMAEVRTAIHRAMSGKDSRMPTPRDILSANVSGTTLKNPILDFTGLALKTENKNFLKLNSINV